MLDDQAQKKKGLCYILAKTPARGVCFLHGFSM